jgi:hypothetical protein
MLATWRTFVLAVLSLLVIICYPYYDVFGIATLFIIFTIASSSVILLTMFANILCLSRLKMFNMLFDIVMSAVFLYALLAYIPQEGIARPLDKLSRGIYPTKKEIKYGVARLGLLKQRAAATKELINNYKELQKKLNQVETIINKDWD